MSSQTKITPVGFDFSKLAKALSEKCYRSEVIAPETMRNYGSLKRTAIRLTQSPGNILGSLLGLTSLYFLSKNLLKISEAAQDSFKEGLKRWSPLLVGLGGSIFSYVLGVSGAKNTELHDSRIASYVEIANEIIQNIKSREGLKQIPIFGDSKLQANKLRETTLDGFCQKYKTELDEAGIGKYQAEDDQGFYLKTLYKVPNSLLPSMPNSLCVRKNIGGEEIIYGLMIEVPVGRESYNAFYEQPRHIRLFSVKSQDVNTPGKERSIWAFQSIEELFKTGFNPEKEIKPQFENRFRVFNVDSA